MFLLPVKEVLVEKIFDRQVCRLGFNLTTIYFRVNPNPNPSPESHNLVDSIPVEEILVEEVFDRQVRRRRFNLTTLYLEYVPPFPACLNPRVSPR